MVPVVVTCAWVVCVRCAEPLNEVVIEIQDDRAANQALEPNQDERFFNKLEDDVSRIIQQEKRREQFVNSQGQEVNTSTEHEQVSRVCKKLDGVNDTSGVYCCSVFILLLLL